MLKLSPLFTRPCSLGLTNQVNYNEYSISNWLPIMDWRWFGLNHVMSSVKVIHSALYFESNGDYALMATGSLLDAILYAIYPGNFVLFHISNWIWIHNSNGGLLRSNSSLVLKGMRLAVLWLFISVSLMRQLWPNRHDALEARGIRTKEAIYVVFMMGVHLNVRYL